MMDQQSSHQASAPSATTEIARRVLDDIGRLNTMTVAGLKHKWRELLGIDVPPFAKRGLLTQVLAWELQAKTFGGLTPALHRKLVSLGSGNSLEARQTETCKVLPCAPALNCSVSGKG